MSLATIAFSRLATKIITPLSWAASSSSVATPSSTIGSAFLQRSGVLVGSQYQLSSIRSVFSEVIRQVPSDDPQKQGMLTFEDPDLADARIVRNIRGESPLRRRKKFLRHEKGWMRRKRMKMERRHLRLHEQVEELKTFIKFKQDYRP
uniref:Uncharacterized protein n=1 Tax=Skeletonema marinoi TaxID=267567 RepID=A0A7S2KT48_9STRA